MGGAAAGLGTPVWLAGTVGTVTALVAAVIVDRVFGTRDDRKAALEVPRREYQRRGMDDEATAHDLKAPQPTGETEP